MSWPKRKLFNHGLGRGVSQFLILTAILLLAACGVKGDPLPPEKPVEIGRGRPTYKRATEGIKIEKNKTVPAKPVDKEVDKEQDTEDEDEDGVKK